MDTHTFGTLPFTSISMSQPKILCQTNRAETLWRYDGLNMFSCEICSFNMAPTQACQGKWTDASYLLGTEPMAEPSTSFGTPLRDHMEVESVQIPGEMCKSLKKNSEDTKT